MEFYVVNLKELLEDQRESKEYIFKLAFFSFLTIILCAL